MSEIENFKDTVRSTSHRYRDAAKVCGQASQQSDVLEKRIASVIEIGSSLLHLNPDVGQSIVSNESLLNELVDISLEAKEATPPEAELIGLDSHLDYPDLDRAALLNAWTMERIVSEVHDSPEIIGLVQSAFEKFTSAIDELGQARNLLVHKGRMMKVAEGAGESIAVELELYNHSF